jgi:hypothetical protein
VRRLCVGVVVSSVFALFAPACGSDQSSPPTETSFDRKNFSHSTKVDNTWLPLVPGTQLTYEGRANRGTGALPHRIVSIVTDLTKVISGIRAVVIWERDFNEGQMVESELAFQAQDDDGNVWNLGEYPETYEQGKLTGAEDTWLTGRQRAQPGILMRAKPKVGSSSYLQGWAPAIEFRDRAKELKVGQRNCIAGQRCYKNVLVTDEWNPLDPPDGHQVKYYAPGVGTIRVEPGVGDKDQETLVLVGKVRLGAKALAAARAEALKEDARGYKVSKAVYGNTERAKRTARVDRPE